MLSKSSPKNNHTKTYLKNKCNYAKYNKASYSKTSNTSIIKTSISV